MAAVLSAIFALTAASGCKEKKGHQNLSKDEKGVYYTDSDGNKVYKVVMMDHGVALTSDTFKYRDEVMEKINEKLLKDLGYKVDIDVEIYSDDTFADKLATKLSDGDQLDLVRQVNRDNLTSYVSQGIAKKITSYVNASAEMKASLPEKIFDEVTYNGEIYAIPLDKLPLNTAIFVRGDLVKKAGLTSLDTIADWETFFQKVIAGGTEYLNSRLSTFPLMGSFSSLEEMFYNAYSEHAGNFMSGGSIRPKYFDAGYKQFVLKMREWIRNEYIDDKGVFNFNEFGCNTTLSNQVTAAIASGIYLLEFGALRSVEKTHKEWEITSFLPVASPSGSYRSDGLMGEFMFVPYSAKSAGVAVELMNWMLYNKENYMLVRCGIEGKTYVVGDDNSIDIPEAEKTNKVTAVSDLIGKLMIGTSVEYNMGYPASDCPDGARKAYADSLAVSSDKLYVDPLVYVSDKLSDSERSVLASADKNAAIVVQNLLTRNKDGSFKIADGDFDATWNKMVSDYSAVSVYDKLTAEYNKLFS